MTLSQAKRNEVVNELMAVAEQRGGFVPTVLVRQVARDVPCHEATVWRWLEAHRSQSGGAQAGRANHLEALSDDHIEVVFAHLGDLTKAKAELDGVDARIAAMSMATFRRRWAEVPSTTRAMARDGAKGVMAIQLRLRYSDDERNARWHLDHQEVPLWVLPRGHTAHPVKPWMTTVIDDNTRRIMSVLLTVDRPNAEHVVVVLADAMRIRRLTGFTCDFGGVPQVVHSDNGSELRSTQVTTMLERLGSTAKATYPYMSHQNGKVERVQHTFQDGLIKGLPGYTGGPRTMSMKDTFGRAAGELLGEDALLELILDWVDEYNNTPHSALDERCSPNEAWRAQETPLTEADPEVIRRAMLAGGRETYRVQPTGVSFKNVYYTAPELAGRVGTNVRVRHMPSDPTFIEIFDGNDNWIATAVPHTSLSAEDRRVILETTKQQYLDARRYHNAAAERRRTQAAIAGRTIPVASAVRTPGKKNKKADEEANIEVGPMIDDPFLAVVDTIEGQS